MKRVLFEIGLAAMIFIAANAVYGIGNLMGRQHVEVHDPAGTLARPLRFTDTVTLMVDPE